MAAKPRDYKRCDSCFGPFAPISKKHRFCSPECKGRFKYTNRDVTTQSQYVQISGNWNRYLSRLLAAGGVKRQGLTVECLLEVLESQGHMCALTGIPLTCQLEVGTNFKTNASVDRIEAGGPYVKSNVQLVCKAVNSFRRDLSIEEFKWWCKRVADYD